MNIKGINGRDKFERVYIYILQRLCSSFKKSVPLFRRIQRFIFLPYCYFMLVNWHKCPENRIQVVKDFIYIFFKMKSFPDFYYPCRLWEMPRSDWHYFYGSNYDALQRKMLIRHVQKEKYEILYEDKLVCSKLCLERKIPIPETLGVVDPETVPKTQIEILKKSIMSGEKLILKPIGGKGGHLIKVITKQESGDIRLLRPDILDLTESNFRDQFNQEYLIQKYVSQHNALNAISDSVNTVRFVTLLKKDGSVVSIGAYIRLGASGGYIDNLSQGGMAVGIDLSSGALEATAFDRHGKEYTAHPDSAVTFSGFVLPFWERVVDLAYMVQSGLPFQKLLGMDIAITKDGPVIIEVNSIYDNVDLEQVCGPILRKKEVLLAYGEYGLLYNKVQKGLYKEALKLNEA